MRSCSGRALDAMCFPTAQSQFGAVCVEWRLACRMSLLIRPLERQAKPPAPPCWINRLRSRWGRRFRLPVEADFYRSSKIPKTVNTRLTQRRACPTLCRAKCSLGGPSLIFITLLTRHTSARRPTLPASGRLHEEPTPNHAGTHLEPCGVMQCPSPARLHNYPLGIIPTWTLGPASCWWVAAVPEWAGTKRDCHSTARR